MPQVVVVGGGLAGAWAALMAAEEGAHVVLLRRAMGATAMSTGAIDFVPPASAAAPADWLRRLPEADPTHPYMSPGRPPSLEELSAEAERLAAVLAGAGLTHSRRLERPALLVAATGQLRRAGMAQRTIDAGDLSGHPTVVVVGIRGLGVLDAPAVAAAIREELGVAATALEIEPPAVTASMARDLDLATVARIVESTGGAEWLGAAVRAGISADPDLVLVPAVLGLVEVASVHSRTSAAAALPVAEVMSAPPSTPGWRLAVTLERVLESHPTIDVRRATATGVRVLEGRAQAVDADDGARIPCDALVLAGGRFIGGGLATESPPREPLLGLDVFAGVDPVAAMRGADLVVRGHFRDQPVLGAGLRVDSEGRPVDRFGRVSVGNAHACGALLAGIETSLRGGGLGVVAWTAARAGRAAARSAATASATTAAAP